MAKIFEMAVSTMGLDEASWKRHANPWSVYTRFLTCLPLLVLAVWSRDWIGWWSLIPVAVALFWIWLNPRAFPAPDNLDNWASKGVMGEQIFLATRKAGRGAAARHMRMAMALSVASGLGVVVLVWGLVVLDPVLTVTSTIITIGAKAWFVDRMVWLYEEHRALGGMVPGLDNAEAPMTPNHPMS